MPPIKKTVVKRIGSVRSQASIRKGWELERQWKHCQEQVIGHEGQLAKAQENKGRQVRQISAGQGYAHRLLAEAILEIKQEEALISEFKEQGAALQREIEALNPDPLQMKERAA